MARDDFPRRQIELLAQRVAYLCSAPDCKKVTVGPGQTREERSVIGVAAHICAASPGGPRFDPGMTALERGSIKNAIWLCNNCSRKIDNDSGRYPVGLLLQWKQHSEAEALMRIGKRHPNDDDARSQLRAMLHAQGSHFVPQAVVNVHRASEAELERLDPRFSARSTFIDGHASYVLEAKESVDLRFRFNPKVVQTWHKEVAALVRHGKTLRLPMDGVSIEGSDLFQELGSEGCFGTTNIEIQAVRREAFVRVSLSASQGPECTQFEMTGTCSGGTHSATVAVHGFDGLLKLVFRQRVGGRPGRDVVVAVALDESAWAGKDVRLLKGYHAVRQFFTLALGGGRLHADLYVDNRRVLKAIWPFRPNDRYFVQIMNQLDYLERAMCVADYLNVRIAFVAGYTFGYAEHVELAGAAALTKGERVDVFTDPVSCTLTLRNDLSNDAREMLAKGSAALLRFVESQGKAIHVYGQSVNLPRQEVSLSAVTPTCSKKPEELCGGEELVINWCPTGTGEARVRFVHDEDDI